MGFLIDTCIWIDVEVEALAPADVATVTGNQPVYMSPVTIAELKFGVDAAKDPAIRQKKDWLLCAGYNASHCYRSMAIRVKFLVALQPKSRQTDEGTATAFRICG